MVNVLVVSPHLDDAALSFGASLAQLSSDGQEVLVYTAFAGVPSPPYPAEARRFHELWDLRDDPVRARRAEDAEAMRILGARGVHGPFLDKIYRDGGGEPGLTGDIERSVRDLIDAHRPGLVLTCAALGRHKDHRIARDATLGAAVADGAAIRLWEDLPYGIWADEPPPLPSGLEWGPAVRSECGTEAWNAKIEAVAAYVSQHAMLRYEETTIEEQLERHARTVASGSALGERAWTVG